jgi:HEAT repeat protein
VLTDLVEHENEDVRCRAIEALGDIGTGASPSLLRVVQELQDTSPEVRSKAAQSIGTIASASDCDTCDTVSALAAAMTDSHDRVRRNAVVALCRIAPQSDLPVSALQTALTDENRYVRGDAVHALRRLNTQTAKDILIDYLTRSRWCPLTSNESTH